MTSEPVFVHPKGLCESSNVGPGTRVWAFAHVMEGAVVGAGCNIGDHAFIERGALVGDRVTVKNAVLLWDGVTIEDEVFLGPNAVFTNDLVPRATRKKAPDELLPTLVERGATVGANATIICGTTIGKHALVAGGAVVTADVPAHALVAGNPARRVGWVCACGERLGRDLSCACGRRYRQAGGEDGGLVEEPASSECRSDTALSSDSRDALHAPGWDDRWRDDMTTSRHGEDAEA